jgi:hypothetical protein
VCLQSTQGLISCAQPAVLSGSAVTAQARVRLVLVADLCVIHTMLPVQVCRMQELRAGGGVRRDFTGNPGRLVVCGSIGVPASSSWKGIAWIFESGAKAAMETPGR